MNEIKPGVHVEGVYCGVKYEGVVKWVKPTPLGDQIIEINVTPVIVVNSIVRRSIAILKSQITNTIKELK